VNLALKPLPFNLEPKNMRIPILYQDVDIVVVDKPAGIPTHAPDPGDPYPGDALRIVQAQTGRSYLGMHQRLDADTSGVLLFAARREANRALAAAFEGRTVRKVYLALVHGAPPRPEGMIDAPIAREHGERYRVTMPADPRGLAARTRYRVLETYSVVRNAYSVVSHEPRFVRQPRFTQYAIRSTTSDEYSAADTLLELIPETGRPHQIRVHLAHLGCPVVGDPLYGPTDFPASRLYLHAYQLTLPHPATGEPLTFTAPVPSFFPVPRGLAAEQGTAEPQRQPSANAAWMRESGGRSSGHSGADSWTVQLAHAIARRAPLAADPSTEIYRLINGAADGWPDLTVDRYGEALVASVYDDENPKVAPDLEVLTQIAGARSVYVKQRPQQASRISEAAQAELAPARPSFGPDLGEFIAREDGLAYVIRPGAGFSVGLFPDMREGRARVRAWAAGRRVLNTFAYTCGFGVAATAGGAARVLNLDLSKSVLEWGQANYRANGFAPDPHDFVFGDVFDWLARLAKRDDRFDLVIVDPPGFSRTKGRAFSAARDYGELAGLAARVTTPGGLLLACCNVADLPWRSFRERLLAGVAAAGRAPTIKGVYHEPALDFPVPPRGEPYLKMALVAVG
jgi:23S rRNA (cytosine1962-C5)-methyltransferase